MEYLKNVLTDSEMVQSTEHGTLYYSQESSKLKDMPYPSEE